MNALRIAAAFVAVVSLSLGAGCGGPADEPRSSVAQAFEAQTCLDAIAALRTATAAATIKDGKDASGLLQKLDEAQKKFEAGKVADGLDKLADFQKKVQNLLDAGKIDAATAEALLAGVAAAEAACAP